MSTETIDSLIAAHTIPDSASADTAKPAAQSNTVNQADNDTQDNLNDDGQSDNAENNQQKEDMWPKKAVNALKYRDRTIGKQKAMIDAANRELAELRLKVAPPVAENKTVTTKTEYPFKPDDFDNLGDFMAAVARHEAKQESASIRKENEDAAAQTAKSNHVAQLEKVVAAQLQEFVKATPDALEVLQENQDVLEELPNDVYETLLECENPSMVVYNLAKADMLEHLATMKPMQLARAIAKAEAMGSPKANGSDNDQASADRSDTSTKKATDAPAPPANGAAKGTGSSAEKSPERMSREELRAWRNS